MKAQIVLLSLYPLVVLRVSVTYNRGLDDVEYTGDLISNTSPLDYRASFLRDLYGPASPYLQGEGPSSFLP